MEFRNLTPFAVQNYKMLDKSDKEHHVVVMKAGYQLSRDAHGDVQAVVMDSDPVALSFQDVFAGEVNQSSELQESDLAPFKPLCDVIITATAYAPEGKPCAAFPVSVTLTRADGEVLLNKTLTVAGAQHIEQQGWPRQWELSEPAPFVALPINYEVAFGGECRIERDDEAAAEVPAEHQLTPEQQNTHPQAPASPLAHTVFTANPIGMGYIEPWYARAKKVTSLPLPRITDPRHPYTQEQAMALLAGTADLNAPAYQPAGFGLIGRAWQPRLAKAGTYDEAWLENRHPNLPADFDFNYWNGAPADQQITFPPLNLKITLHNLTPGGSLQFTLPDHLAFILLRLKNGAMVPQKMWLDTLYIDAEQQRVIVTWRYVLAADAPLRVMEARYEVHPEQWLEKIYPVQVDQSHAKESE